MLPYLERADVFNSLNYGFAWDATENRTTREFQVSTFLRPEDTPGPVAITKFVAVVDTLTPFPDAVNLKFSDIKDGMSTTVMFGEIAESDILWAEPRDLRLGTMDFRINGPLKRKSLGSPYGDARVVFMDGMVRVLKNKTHPTVLRALLTANGGEALHGEPPDWSLSPAPGL